MSSFPEHQLLLGLLALRLDFVSQEDLLVAVRTWAADGSGGLGEALVNRGALTPADLAVLDGLLVRYVERHDGRCDRSLAALQLTTDFQDELREVVPRALSQSLSSLPTPPPPGFAGPAVPGQAPRASAPRFRVLRPHAEGGLGRVSVARDEELRRDVALKEIQEQYADDPIARFRFLREAEVTGCLEHPGIVPVYGLGRGADGRPYYAMRFIHGESLEAAIRDFHGTNWSKSNPGEQALRLRQLLRRFLDACNAVAYGHSRGVVHRDLKPANIMLGPYGETLVVDWGLARRLHDAEAPQENGQQASATEAAATQQGQVLGTPSYMAPEQVGHADEAGPAADVYGLGATLYHLLTGKAPFEGGPMLEMLGRVVKGQWRPAREVSPATSAALSAVCARAMALRPEDRYASAQDLAADVERWLADEPVSVYREPLSARIGRWGRRHRTLTGVAAALLLAGAVGLGLGLWAVGAEQQRTAKERDIAEANLALAKNVVDECFLVAKEQPLMQDEHVKPVRKLLLEKALPFYRDFKARRPDDPAIQKEMARIAYRVGVITAELGNKAEAVDRLEEARALGAGLLQQSPDDPRLRYALGLVTRECGLARYAAGDVQGALALYDEALHLEDAVPADVPDPATHMEQLASTHNDIGTAQRALGNLAAGRRGFEESERLHAELARRYPDRDSHRADLAIAHHNTGLILGELGDLKAAARSCRDAAALLGPVVDAHPEVARYRVSLGLVQHNLGSDLQRLGDRRGALQAFQEAARIRSQLAEQYPSVPRYQDNVTNTLACLGGVQQELGDHQGALRSLKEGLRAQERLVKRDPTSPRYQEGLGDLHSGMAMLQRVMGDRKGAAKSCVEAVAARRRLLDCHPEVPRYREILAGALLDQGVLQDDGREHAAALRSFREARQLRMELVEKYPDVPEYLAGVAAGDLNIAASLGDTGDPAGAIQALQAALRTQQKLAALRPEVERYRAELARTWNNLGNNYKNTDPKSAREAYEEALRLKKELAAKQPDALGPWIDLAGTQVNLASFSNDNGEASAALPLVEEAIKNLRKVCAKAPDHPKARLFLRNACSVRGDVRAALGRHAEAAADYAEAVALDDGKQVVIWRIARAAALARAGDHAGAAAEAQRAVGGPFPASWAPYRLACAWSLCAKAAAEDAKLSTAERARLADHYAGLAMEALRKAQAAGLFKAREAVKEAGEDPDLEVLRRRDDFRSFFAGLEGGAKPEK